MPKQLLLMRHSESPLAANGLSDFQRPLNQRGQALATRMAEFIHSQDLIPDRVISSSARRAEMTTELLAQGCPGLETNQLSFGKVFYLAPAEIYLAFLEKFNVESVTTLMLVGHNPGLEELIQKICGISKGIPPAAIAQISLEIENWSDLASPITGDLENFWTPENV
jgi:phosphohistidine phosphatase